MPGARVEVVAPARAAAYDGAWRDLSARALEANVFAEPDFILAALSHFARVDRLRLLLVWRDESEEQLIGATVLEFPRIAVGFGVARIWRSDQAGLAAILLDREAAEPALAAVLDWLAAARPRTIGLMLPSADASGPTVAALQALGLRRGAQSHHFGQATRAILIAAGKLARGFEGALPKKRLKEWARQIRRLKERGEIGFRTASDEAAIEKFLALEARGWKGAQHTALGADAGLAAFTRSMLAGLARRDRLAIHLLELGGEALAIGVVLRAGDRAFYWKTAYDEAYAEYSPGLQLTLELSRLQQRDPGIAATDSCAIEGHPMIDRLWTARLTLVDCVIALRPGPARGLGVWLAAEMARRRLREAAKRAINPLRGRKRS
jgi:CelD/BcsL family acetyltransferase involved in cellulose biosynthesis